jgi:two-component sensor histidine kinase
VRAASALLARDRGNGEAIGDQHHVGERSRRRGAVGTLMPRAGSDTGQGRDEITVLQREFGANSLSGLRAQVLECASAAGLPDDRAIDVMLTLHELMANAVRHGPGHGRLRIDVTARALRCQVSEAGVAAAGLAGGGRRFIPDWPVRHGHGLWLVRRTADLVQLTTGAGGTVADVSFSLPPG